MEICRTCKHLSGESHCRLHGIRVNAISATCEDWGSDPEPPAQPAPGHTLENPYSPEGQKVSDTSLSFKLRSGKYHIWEEGRVAGDAVGYARGRGEKEVEDRLALAYAKEVIPILQARRDTQDALVTELVNALEEALLAIDRDSWSFTRARLDEAIAKAKGES